MTDIEAEILNALARVLENQKLTMGIARLNSEYRPDRDALNEASRLTAGALKRIEEILK